MLSKKKISKKVESWKDALRKLDALAKDPETSSFIFAERVNEASTRHHAILGGIQKMNQILVFLQFMDNKEIKVLLSGPEVEQDKVRIMSSIKEFEKSLALHKMSDSTGSVKKEDAEKKNLARICLLIGLSLPTVQSLPTTEMKSQWIARHIAGAWPSLSSTAREELIQWELDYEQNPVASKMMSLECWLVEKGLWSDDRHGGSGDSSIFFSPLEFSIIFQVKREVYRVFLSKDEALGLYEGSILDLVREVEHSVLYRKERMPTKKGAPAGGGPKKSLLTLHVDFAASLKKYDGPFVDGQYLDPVELKGLAGTMTVLQVKEYIVQKHYSNYLTVEEFELIEKNSKLVLTEETWSLSESLPSSSTTFFLEARRVTDLKGKSLWSMMARYEKLYRPPEDVLIAYLQTNFCPSIQTTLMRFFTVYKYHALDRLLQEKSSEAHFMNELWSSKHSADIGLAEEIVEKNFFQNPKKGRKFKLFLPTSKVNVFWVMQLFSSPHNEGLPKIDLYPPEIWSLNRSQWSAFLSKIEKYPDQEAKLLTLYSTKATATAAAAVVGKKARGPSNFPKVSYLVFPPSPVDKKDKRGAASAASVAPKKNVRLRDSLRDQLAVLHPYILEKYKVPFLEFYVQPLNHVTISFLASEGYLGRLLTREEQEKIVEDGDDRFSVSIPTEAFFLEGLDNVRTSSSSDTLTMAYRPETRFRCWFQLVDGRMFPVDQAFLRHRSKWMSQEVGAFPVAEASVRREAEFAERVMSQVLVFSQKSSFLFQELREAARSRCTTLLFQRMNRDDSHRMKSYFEKLISSFEEYVFTTCSNVLTYLSKVGRWVALLDLKSPFSTCQSVHLARIAQGYYIPETFGQAFDAAFGLMVDYNYYLDPKQYEASFNKYLSKTFQVELLTPLLKILPPHEASAADTLLAAYPFMAPLSQESFLVDEVWVDRDGRVVLHLSKPISQGSKKKFDDHNVFEQVKYFIRHPLDHSKLLAYYPNDVQTQVSQSVFLLANFRDYVLKEIDLL